jgi:hypothetical protein
MSDQRDWQDSAEPMLITDPTENIEAAEPTLASDATEPTLPMDSADPCEAMDSTESVDQSDHRDPREVMATLWISNATPDRCRRGSGQAMEPPLRSYDPGARAGAALAQLTVGGDDEHRCSTVRHLRDDLVVAGTAGGHHRDVGGAVSGDRPCRPFDDDHDSRPPVPQRCPLELSRQLVVGESMPCNGGRGGDETSCGARPVTPPSVGT